MTAATNLTFAAILSLVARFQEGRAALDAGRPADAVAALTAVVDADPGLSDLAAAARLLRARAHAAAKNEKAARADWLRLATHPSPADLRALARREYLAAGGDAADLTPKLSPAAEWQRLQESIENERANEIEASLTRGFREWVRSMGRMMGDDEGPDFADILSQDESVLEDQATDEEAGVARLVFRDDSIRHVVHWVQEGPRWLVSAMEIRPAATDGEFVKDGAMSDPFGPVGERARAEQPEAPATPLAPDRQAEIEACIRLLGDADAAARARARARLREIGADARPLLRARIHDPDPEIAVTARELLESP